MFYLRILNHQNKGILILQFIIFKLKTFNRNNMSKCINVFIQFLLRNYYIQNYYHS